MARIPNFFTPNGDGTNDIFSISVNLSVEYNLNILNRWGNVMFHDEGKLNEGKNDLWNGGVHNGSEKVTDGTYFYKFRFVLDKNEVKCQNSNPTTIGCEAVKEGFLDVRK